MTFIFVVALCGRSIADDAPSLIVEGGTKSLLVSKDEFSIQVSDQVTGGCLPFPNKLKDKMEISLRKNGFDIAKKANFFTNNIYITALGFKISESSCAVHLSAELIFPVVANVPFAEDEPKGSKTLVPFIYKIGDVILAGERYSMQDRLSKTVTEFADKLYLDISRSKDDVFKKFPSIKEAIIKSRSKK